MSKESKESTESKASLNKKSNSESEETKEQRELRRKRELNAAQSRFRARQRERAAEIADHADVRSIRNRQRMILRWTFLSGVVFVGIAYFIAMKQAPPTEPPPPKNPELPVPMLGDAGKAPAGTNEVQGSKQTGIGLAQGSELAIRTQIEATTMWKLPLEIENSIGMRFRLIPAGTFLMGSKLTEPGRGPDEPEHVRTVRNPFYMGVFEVTQSQWEAVMGPENNPSIFKRSNENRPVEEVSWDMAKKFVKALAKKEGVSPKAYRLPLESEWEYACRAGTQTPFYTGETREDLARAANFSWNNEQGTAKVGMRQPNAWGLHDMHGNVWEWCENVFQEYKGKRKADPYRRVIRGGNWKLPWLDCRSSSRYRLTNTSHGNILGLRLVRVLSPEDLKHASVPAAAPAPPIENDSTPEAPAE